MNVEDSGFLVTESRGGGGGLASGCECAAVCAGFWDLWLRLHVSCWSTEIIFSNMGARMLNFLEGFLCVLWVCACGLSPSRRELLA